jgi:hypothetical protein
VSEKTYYCKKCGHKHRYTSKIGIQHIQYKTSASTSSINTVSVKDNDHLIQEQKHDLPKKFKETDKPKNFIQRYHQSYGKGVEKFGIWWKIFNWSMWIFILVFFFTASILLVFYLPRMQMILGK